MKTNKYTKVLAAAAIVLAASACDENSWNDKLDGFDKIENESVTDVQTVEYTLTDADYKTIAGLAENTALAGEDGKAALQQVGSMRRFSQAAPASKYVPAFLGNSSFPYFTLTDGSAIRLTYRQADAEPEEYIAGTNPQTYRVSPEQYEKDVWQSENFINAFAPSKQPQNFIPAMLAADVDPADGSICVVTYNVAPQEPVFGGGTPEEPSFELSSVVGSLKNGDAGVTIRGVVMAVCAQGYMLADKTGAIFVYMGSKFDNTTVAVGDQMEVNGSIGAYNKGLQVNGSSATATVLGKQDVTYPAAKEYTGAELDQAITRTDDALGIYATIKGKVTMSYDKEDPTKLKNINIKPAGSAKAQGSVYGFTPELLKLLKADTEQSITGYFIAIAGGKYCNMVVTAVDGKPVYSTSSFDATSVVGSLKDGDAGVTIRGIVMAVCAQGYMLADKTGAIFVYMGSKFDTTTVAVGDQMEVNGSIGAYNKGLQVNGSSATATVLGKQDVTYPAAKEYTGAELDQAITRTDNALGIYATIKGTVALSYDKEDPTKLKNINIKPAGSAKAQGSVYGFTPEVTAMLKDGSEQTITGYFIAIAGGKYCNMVVTEIDGKSVNSAAARMMSRAGLDVFAETHSTVYHYSANRWSVADNFSVLSPDDYTAMGRPTGDLTAAEPYLSQYVNSKFPYGNEGDIRYVIWNHYAGGETSFACAAFKRGTSAWEPYDFTITETNQFVRNGGKWMYDPNVTINLPAGKGQEMSTLYFQTCVNWVYENICRPLGDTDIKSGKFYISSYGNNEYYSGTSAYQGNIDLRPSAARSQYPAGYEGMSDDQIIELEKTRFMKEVMPGALSILHSDAKPIEGLSVLYTINFSAYYESKETIAYTAVFEVSGPGQFVPVSCTWWEDGKIPQ